MAGGRGMDGGRRGHLRPPPGSAVPGPRPHGGTYNGSYSLNAQWTLWNGGKRLNNIKQQKTNRDIANLTVEETENMLQEEIAKIFIQILYADESVEINKGTLEVSQATYERGKELFKEGSISKADLAQLESQVSNDQYQLVTAESSLRNYKLQLKQLLELDGTEEMDLVLPELEWFLQAKVPQVKFVDRTFNCKKSHAMAIWQYISGERP